MKLGEKVIFSNHYIKSGQNFDPKYDGTEEAEESGVVINRWQKVSDGKQREGIVVGKRRYASGYRFDYIENGNGPSGSDGWRWESTPLGKESFYLVATKMNAMFKVKAEDLEPVMIIDPIEGLMDE